MIKKILITCSVLTTLALAQQTTTETTIGEKQYVNENQYGDSVYENTVKITTKNFKVENFWKKFSLNGEGSKTTEFQAVSTTAKFKISVEGSFACKKAGLNEEGCSGQKPFLINESVLSNPELHKDANGNTFSDPNEYRIPLNEAKNYLSTDNTSFYSIDVWRDDVYYKPTGDDGVDANGKPKSFFGYIVAFFQDYFSKDTAIYGENLGMADEAARERYIANMIFGVQKSYRMQKEQTLTLNPSELNGADDAGKVTLLDYNQELTNVTSGCNGLILNYDPNSASCTFINFFGLAQWMPFVDNAPTVETDNIHMVSDTESTLLQLASKMDGVDYLGQRLANEPQAAGKKSFIQEIFKPMSFMLTGLKTFFFGNASKNLTEVFYMDFNFNNPVPLTFAVVDNSGKVSDFAHMDMVGLESVYGTEETACTVKLKSTSKLTDFFTMWFTWFTGKMKVYFDASHNDKWKEGEQHEFVQNGTDAAYFFNVKQFLFYKDYDLKETITNDEWLGWCKRNQGVQKKSFFGNITGSISSFINDVVTGFANPEYTSRDQQVDSLLNCGNTWENFTANLVGNDVCFEIVDYKEKVHKGLVLHLKKSEKYEPEQIGTTTSYELIEIQRGH